LRGSAQRLCREAPAPIVELRERQSAPGGAANTATNLRRLGAAVSLLSVIGDDGDGRLVRESLVGRGVEVEHLLSSRTRRTLSKNRVVADGQLLVRFDQGTTDPLEPAEDDELVSRLESLYARCDAVVVSDYGYGILTPRVRDALRELQARSPGLLVADAKDLRRYRRVGVTVVKPNYAEAVGLLGDQQVEGVRVRLQQVAANGKRLLRLTGARIVAVTLDAEGALIFESGAPPFRTYARPTGNSRAAGAGDTFVSAFTLGLAAGGTTPAAAELASAAAAIVVGKEGTAECSADELRAYLLADDKYARGSEAVARTVAIHREQGRRIVFTNGCFDILHRGHITYLNRAKALGDVLVVAVNSDESVRRLKGHERPINTLDDRVQVLSALSCVDHIVSFDEDTPEELIRIVRPDVFVKGGDYTRDTLPEAPLVEALGGSVQILPYVEDRSTTAMIERIREAGGVSVDRGAVEVESSGVAVGRGAPVASGAVRRGHV
ncbi:MAG: D-glycero-beta-D-manno-heptose 1-phosphate adenylyltransferase, partial [Chloroflexota bacterium]|nr:D-glycero-beta-D-manno-heptose 1-phosphate adenylyltransferase [Chloroflexota bacterium]